MHLRWSLRSRGAARSSGTTPPRPCSLVLEACVGGEPLLAAAPGSARGHGKSTVPTGARKNHGKWGETGSVLPVTALEKAMTRAIALKKRQAIHVKVLEKGNDKGYCLEKRQAVHVKVLEKGNDKGYCLEKWQGVHVKALEQAITRGIALRKGQRCRSEPWKRQ